MGPPRHDRQATAGHGQADAPATRHRHRRHTGRRAGTAHATRHGERRLHLHAHRHDGPLPPAAQCAGALRLLHRARLLRGAHALAHRPHGLLLPAPAQGARHLRLHPPAPAWRPRDEIPSRGLRRPAGHHLTQSLLHRAQRQPHHDDRPPALHQRDHGRRQDAPGPVARRRACLCHQHGRRRAVLWRLQRFAGAPDARRAGLLAHDRLLRHRQPRPGRAAALPTKMGRQLGPHRLLLRPGRRALRVLQQRAVLAQQGLLPAG